ncbi:alpha/beta hydrolase [Actinoplanes teichomyceticus]|uniref:Putative membrane protein n=1 Tax=Actinoplanes teichomyceticus TaxID=1867 RepID=A0A561WMN2_ACTTI|nr:alpha/beta-hydrolase family protein [Actinoplanes teichomyceticus]TWG25137.1 putative membrane protein [Actinoplanes teichomyceticus]GIF10209.1 membrane protein [Actinoplanes teichomyceticus]
MRKEVVAPPPDRFAPLRARIPRPRRPPEEPGAAERNRPRIMRAALSLTGAGLAAAFYCLAFTPSLLPRTGILQGVVAGITAAMGYALGTAIGALIRIGVRFSPRAVRIWWRVLGVLLPPMIATCLWLGTRWQRELRLRLGMTPAQEYDTVRTVGASLLTFAAILLIARALRLATHGCAQVFRLVVPDRAAYCAGTVVVAVLSYTAFDGLLVAHLFAVADRSAAVINSGTGNGVRVPASPLRSGGPQSLVGWDTLGRQGRAFVASAPSVEQLSGFAGHPAAEPIRLYAGLASADTMRERADLVVREMDRTGAFGRRVVAVFTPTGTGWVDNRVTQSLEYMYAGDTALVSMQYSYLPSWIAFLGDRSEVVDAASALITAVRQRWAALPDGHRPKLLLFGESLGTYGMEATFGTAGDLVAGADGVLMEGPTFANPIHQRLTRDRAAGSPVWDPLYPGLPIAFADRAAELRDRPGAQPRVVYLQNSSDPIVWWNWDLLWKRPPWLRGERGPDVMPAMRWFPWVTFWQTTCDLVFANKAPTGHGHVYKSATVDGWAAVAPPPGWTVRDTVRLREKLGN